MTKTYLTLQRKFAYFCYTANFSLVFAYARRSGEAPGKVRLFPAVQSPGEAQTESLPCR